MSQAPEPPLLSSTTSPAAFTAPPTGFWPTLSALGPGIILASSIVGSGELIATTVVGAEAGFGLLWLIILGCAVKVAAQIEIGRNAITWGRTPLEAFDRVPGPRLAGRGWIYWCWAVMMLLIVVQQGGILAGVGQSLAAAVPVSTAGRASGELFDRLAAAEVSAAIARREQAADSAEKDAALAALRAEAKALPAANDTSIYTLLMAAVTAVVLASGRYGLIERLSLVLVVGFTLFTFLAVVMLQFDPNWAVSGEEWARGLIPSLGGNAAGLGTALAALGIIGVGAAELMVYPYWCLEKGYGKAIGPRSDAPAWAANARGWLRVMQLDAWGSMIVYTLVTVFFYILGAATLGRLGLTPSGDEMVRTLSQMYVPIFGDWVRQVFLLGAFAVLYSTFFVAAAGNSRMVADGLVLAGLLPGDDASRRTAVRVTCVAWVAAALTMAFLFQAPVAMVLASGVAQAAMLGALAVAVLYFRYRDLDVRLAPGWRWDLLLWVSVAGFLVIAGWTVWQKVSGFFTAFL
jgi:Mn2+/Fe2+ NRAMP family transporter